MGVQNAQKRNLFYVSLTGTKQGEEPMFVVKDSRTKEIINRGEELSGIIKDIKPHQYTYDKTGKTVRGFKMEVVDNGETYACGFSYTYTSRTIINCLTTVEFPGRVRIEVQKAGPDDNGYPSLFVSMDEQTCKWKWKFKELEDKIERFDGGGVNYDKLYDFFDKVIVEKLGPLFRGAFSGLVSGPSAKSNETDELLDEVQSNDTKQPDPKPESESGSIYRKDMNTDDQMVKIDKEDPGSTEESPPAEEQTDDLPF